MGHLPIFDTEATIDFDAVEGATVYAMQYKVGGAHDWRRVRFQIIILILYSYIYKPPPNNPDPTNIQPPFDPTTGLRRSSRLSQCK